MLSITAISPVCLRDAPYIDVTFGNQPQFNGFTATVTFIANNGQVVGTETATYQAGATVRFVYPGASVDAAGNPLDWPGWVFDGDEWVVDPTDAFLREEPHRRGRSESNRQRHGLVSAGDPVVQRKPAHDTAGRTAAADL